MGREIERKFLVRDQSWRAVAGSGTPYRQGYLNLDPERTVRVRVAGDRAFITIKGKTDGAARDEFEYPVPTGDANHLLEMLAIQPIIEKTRYVVREHGLKWEIDEFGGENAGLVVAEVELENSEQHIDKPAWLAGEVTSDPRYFNANLVRSPYSQWKQEVSR